MSTPISIEIPILDEVATNTLISELALVTSSCKQKSGEDMMISDWVRSGLFKYYKFITSSDSMEYGQLLSLFCLEENNITNDKQQWWLKHKRDIVQTLNETRG